MKFIVVINKNVKSSLTMRKNEEISRGRSIPLFSNLHGRIATNLCMYTTYIIPYLSHGQSLLISSLNCASNNGIKLGGNGRAVSICSIITETFKFLDVCELLFTVVYLLF